MTDTHSPAPVTAWAVVDSKGEMRLTELFHSQHDAQSHSDWCDDMCGDEAPHRVIEVTIAPKEKG